MQNFDQFGLTETLWCEIWAVLQRFPIERVMIYGSRARGDFSEVSDIDLAIWTDKTEVKRVVKQCLEEEVETAKEFDVMDFNRSVDDQMKQNILEDGVEIEWDAGCKIAV